MSETKLRGLLREVADGVPGPNLEIPHRVVVGARRRLGLRIVAGLATTLLIAIGVVTAARGLLTAEKARPGDRTTNPGNVATPLSLSCTVDGLADACELLRAGTYSTTRFSPALTFTVPDGWFNDRNVPGAFELWFFDRNVPGAFQLEPQSSGTGKIHMGRDPLLTGSDCAETSALIREPPEAIASWFAEQPALRTTVPQTVTVGGLRGVQFDVTADRHPDCFWFITLKPGARALGSYSDEISPRPDEQMRIYLLRIPATCPCESGRPGTMVIVVRALRTDFKEVIREVTPIIESFQFDVRGNS